MVTLSWPTRELIPESFNFRNSFEARDSLSLSRGEVGKDVDSLASDAMASLEAATRYDPPRTGSLLRRLEGWLSDGFELGLPTRSWTNRFVFPGNISGISSLVTCTTPSVPGGGGSTCGGFCLIFSSSRGP